MEHLVDRPGTTDQPLDRTARDWEATKRQQRAPMRPGTEEVNEASRIRGVRMCLSSETPGEKPWFFFSQTKAGRTQKKQKTDMNLQALIIVETS
mmetsp:Transcript_18551/g.31999  ORF Transcript_18551/g.31999 Transcript_18551/m.31999 type:complete len:94 (-) Transcript_18551:1092-1373(-)